MFALVQSACSSGGGSSSSTQRWQADHSYSHMAPTGRPQRKHAVFFSIISSCPFFHFWWKKNDSTTNKITTLVLLFVNTQTLQCYKEGRCSAPKTDGGEGGGEKKNKKKI